MSALQLARNKRRETDAQSWFGPSQGRIDGENNLTMWRVPRNTAGGSVTLSELKRATKTVGAMRRIDHSRDPADHSAAKKRWGKAKMVTSAISILDEEADMTRHLGIAAGASFGRPPATATQHWGHITANFSEEERRQFAITGERGRKHANKRWAFTDTLGLKAAYKEQQRAQTVNHDRYSSQSYGDDDYDEYGGQDHYSPYSGHDRFPDIGPGAPHRR